jgi:hypothetical protein
MRRDAGYWNSERRRQLPPAHSFAHGMPSRCGFNDCTPQTVR